MNPNSKNKYLLKILDSDGRSLPNVGISKHAISPNWNLKVHSASYSAIVKNQETDVWAENEYGETIIEGEKGVDDAKVIQSAVNTIGEGKIFVAKGTYKITQKITCPAGIIFEGEPGTTLDLTGLNDTAFEFNVGGEYVQKPTGLRYLTCEGKLNNTNLMIAKFENIGRSIVVEHLTLKNIPNGFELTSSCFDSVIRHIYCVSSKNIVKLTATTTKPNNTLIDHIEISAGWGSILDGYLVYIDEGTQSVTITDSWCEALTKGVVNYGLYTKIRGNTLSCTQKCIEVGGDDVKIVDNTISPTGDGAIGIDFITKNLRGKIIGNTFKSYSCDNVIFINNALTSDVYFEISSNYFRIEGTSSGCYCIKGRITLSQIVGNKFEDLAGGNTAMYFDYSVHNVIEGNSVEEFGTGIYKPNYSLVANNRMYNVTTPYTIVETNTYCDQHLYTTLPDTTNSFVSDIFLNRPIHYYDGTNYYIAVWDGSTWRKVQIS